MEENKMNNQQHHQREGQNQQEIIKSYLIQQLSHLLFGGTDDNDFQEDDGTAEMILEHLMATMTSRNELNDYLIQLLGHTNEQFINDIMTYQNQSIVMMTGSTNDKNNMMESLSILLQRIQLHNEKKQKRSHNLDDGGMKAPTASSTAASQIINKNIDKSVQKMVPPTSGSKNIINDNNNKKNVQPQKQQLQQSKQQEKKMNNNKKQQQQQKQQSSKSSSAEIPITTASSTTDTTIKELIVGNIESKPLVIVSQQPDIITPPKKGIRQNPIICNCYGTKHEAVANCLQCGRITCSYEGGANDYCPYCSYWIPAVEKPIMTSRQTDTEKAM